MQLGTYLDFDGNCAEAFEFYSRHLGAEITAMMTWRDGPMADQVPPEALNQVMHASLEIDGHVLMGSDGMPGQGCAGEAGARRVAGSHVVIGVDEPREAERIFAALSEDGSVEMDMEETFWAKRFGMVIDRFGIPWMINCEKKEE